MLCRVYLLEPVGYHQGAFMKSIRCMVSAIVLASSISFLGSSCSPPVTVDTSADLEYALTDTQWVYDTVGFSTVSLYVKGATNARMVLVETHGDGLYGNYPLDLNSSGEFEDTVSIAFSHVNGLFLSTSTRIKFYGYDNDSQFVSLSCDGLN
jgi:hypothetical protein